MRRIVLFTGMLLMISLFQAQGHPDNRHQQRVNEIRQKKTAFIQQRVNLTPAEAKEFWPVYYEYEQKRWDLMKASRANFKRDMGLKGSAVNYAEMAENMINFDLMRAQLAKTYYERFKRILPPQKLFQYYVADKEFKEWLLQDIQREAAKHQHH